MPNDIFISYSRRDLAAVNPIKEELESLGFSCWMDLEGIESGSEEFSDPLIAAINASIVLLFFLSGSSQKSEWSLKELRFAKKKQKRIVLVRFNNDLMTDSFDFNFEGSDIIDWRMPEQKSKLIRDLMKWTGRGDASSVHATHPFMNRPPQLAPRNTLERSIQNATFWPEGKTEFDVVLAEIGTNKIAVIKEVRAITGLGLKDAKDLVDGAPKAIKTGIAKDEAQKIKEQVEKAGARVEIR